MPNSVTQILQALQAPGAQGGRASDDLLPLVYDELRQMARRYMGEESSGHTLQATALVHEAYMRLVGAEGGHLQWNSRGHFFAAAAIAMRRILVERARQKQSESRGGGRQRICLDGVEPASDSPKPDADAMVALDAALSLLESFDPRKAKLVMLRYFAGLTIEQTAQAMELSATTVKQEWQFARAWLQSEIERRKDG